MRGGATGINVNKTVAASMKRRVELCLSARLNPGLLSALNLICQADQAASGAS